MRPRSITDSAVHVGVGEQPVERRQRLRAGVEAVIWFRRATSAIAGRLNLLASATSQTSRDWAMMVCATCTSRRS